jgi:hypothetical protein
MTTTFVGIQLFPGAAALLVNVSLPDGSRTTRTLVSYDEECPVLIGTQPEGRAARRSRKSALVD